MLNKKLLIIEDDMVLQSALNQFLLAEGFEVECAGDGETGIKMALSGKPDLILLDIVLPKKDGYAVLAEVRSNEDAKHIPIVLLTNLGSITDVEKALEMGATTYLVKADYKLEEITLKIKEILRIK